MDASDVIWLAGVVDARGHIEVRSRRGDPEPAIRITTRRIALLARCAELTGTKVNEDKREYERRPCSTHCSAQHQHVQRQSAFWQVAAGRATVVLWNIRPYIRAQEIEVRDALLHGLDRWPPPRGNTGHQMGTLGWELPPADADSRRLSL